MKTVKRRFFNNLISFIWNVSPSLAPAIGWCRADMYLLEGKVPRNVKSVSSSTHVLTKGRSFDSPCDS